MRREKAGSVTRWYKENRVQDVSAMAEPKRRPLGEGAAQAAPTAPHATPRVGKDRRNGPERFWARWPVRVALALCLVISGIVHCSMMPFGAPHGFEVNDVQGEAAIPVDVLSAADDTPPPPAAPSPPIEPPEQDKDNGPAATLAHADAGVRPDAHVSDASADGESDAGPDGPAAVDGEIALADDAGAGSTGPRDPEAIVGAVGTVQADVIYVILVINAEVIRTHPVGARLGYLLRAIPQWDDFVNGTDIDPIRDTDWVMISGPSLVNTSRDVVLVHYAASDTVVDHAVDVLSRKYDRGGRIDAGVPGVRASLAHADRAERVILRAQPHVLALVPPSVAQREARKLVSARVPARLPARMAGDAVYLRLVDPHHPFPEIPESVTELRMRVVPRADAGADVFIEGDTKDPDTATEAAAVIRRVIRRHDDALTSLLTHGLLDHVDVGTNERFVKVHLTATRDQIENLVTLVGDLLGVQSEVAPGSTTRPVPAPPRSRPMAPGNPQQPR